MFKESEKGEQEIFLIRCGLHEAAVGYGHVDIPFLGGMIVYQHIVDGIPVLAFSPHADHVIFQVVVKDPFFNIDSQFFLADIIKERFEFEIRNRKDVIGEVKGKCRDED